MPIQVTKVLFRDRQAADAADSRIRQQKVSVLDGGKCPSVLIHLVSLYTDVAMEAALLVPRNRPEKISCRVNYRPVAGALIERLRHGCGGGVKGIDPAIVVHELSRAGDRHIVWARNARGARGRHSSASSGAEWGTGKRREDAGGLIDAEAIQTGGVARREGIEKRNVWPGHHRPTRGDSLGARRYRNRGQSSKGRVNRIRFSATARSVVK